ncbi:unnamed protein product [Psylliodes chrysocephalus]|uniref:MADF domain-containing protein n=1 Tax=Psylliodes chrysocephalus TaxID=3402493 RepID=A0A9P0GL44_9CUCU|nr:unnamed protein product [Psylliodes chrysocephala]
MEITDESLIENVQIHPILYNLKLPQYRDHNMRQEAWEEIGKELNMPAETLKKKWDKLRRCYINALSRRRTRREDSTKNIHPWKYELQMSFLLPFIESRKQHSLNLPNNVEIFIEDSDIQNENKYDTAEDQDQKFDTSLYENDDSSNLSAKLSLPSVKRLKLMRSDNAYQEAVNVYNEDVSNRKFNETYSATSILDMDETDMFFISMSKMTKKLAPIDQAKIKLLLSNAVLSAQISMSENQSEASNSKMCSD